MSDTPADDLRDVQLPLDIQIQLTLVSMRFNYLMSGSNDDIHKEVQPFLDDIMAAVAQHEAKLLQGLLAEIESKKWLHDDFCISIITDEPCNCQAADWNKAFDEAVEAIKALQKVTEGK